MKKINADIYADLLSQAADVENSQSAIAESLGVTAGAVWQMIKSD